MQSCYKLALGTRYGPMGLLSLVTRGEGLKRLPMSKTSASSASAAGMSPSDGYNSESRARDDQNLSTSSMAPSVTPDDALREMGSRNWSRSLGNTLSLLKSLAISLAAWILSCREILPQFYAPSPGQAVQRCFLVLGTTLILCFLITGIDKIWTSASLGWSLLSR
jgi:hypothetical protein